MEESSRKNLIAALVKVQGATKNPKKETDNPFFKSKYADLAAVWDSVRDLLSNNGLAFMQLPTTDGARVSLTGILYHTSGESIESVISATAKDNGPQAIGSTITYLRRYQMGAMLGICSEADDDGNAASDIKPKSIAQQKGPFSHGITKEQHDANQSLKQKPKDPATVLAENIGLENRDLGDFRDIIVTGSPKQIGNYKGWEIETESYGKIVTFLQDVAAIAKQAKDAKELVHIYTEPSSYGPKIVDIKRIPFPA